MTTVVLTIQALRPPLLMNEARRASWQQKRAAKIHGAWLVKDAAKRAKCPRFERCRITVTWFAPNLIRRDADSLGFFIKSATDALVPNYIPADDHRHVTSSEMRVRVDQTNPRIEIELEAVA